MIRNFLARFALRFIAKHIGDNPSFLDATMKAIHEGVKEGMVNYPDELGKYKGVQIEAIRFGYTMAALVRNTPDLAPKPFLGQKITPDYEGMARLAHDVVAAHGNTFPIPPVRGKRWQMFREYFQ